MQFGSSHILFVITLKKIVDKSSKNIKKSNRKVGTVHEVESNARQFTPLRAYFRIPTPRDRHF